MPTSKLISKPQEPKGPLDAIKEGKKNFTDDEQTIINAWVEKLESIDGSDKAKEFEKNQYIRRLNECVNSARRLSAPFTELPPEGDLPPLEMTVTADLVVKSPAPPKKGSGEKTPKRSHPSGAIPKCTKVTNTKKCTKNQSSEPPTRRNEYADPQEMAKAIARSKGQSFPEFVASIARHTSDYGQALNQAMKAEISNFRDYVDSVLSQRIKDLTEVLDEEQSRELKRIKKDIERWQLELFNVKRRIKDILPEFNMEYYKRDKNYLKKIFLVEIYAPIDDTFKRWKDETYHRLKWFTEMTCKATKCNEQTNESIADVTNQTMEIEALESSKIEDQLQFLNSEINEYRKLKNERDLLQKEYLELMGAFEEGEGSSRQN